MAKSKSYMAAYRAAKGMDAEPGMRFEPWTRETYPGIWLPYKEWDSVRRAINNEYGEEIELLNEDSIVVGQYRYHFYVLEFDDYVVTDVELIHESRRARR